MKLKEIDKYEAYEGKCFNCHLKYLNKKEQCKKCNKILERLDKFPVYEGNC